MPEPASQPRESTHVWFWRKFRGDRKDHPCRIIVPPASNGNIMVEFEDGERIVAPRYCVRRLTSSQR